MKLSRIPYATFSAVGKILYREVRRSHLLALLIDKKFKPIHDRIRNPAIGDRDPRDRELPRAQAGGQGLPRVLPAAALPRVHRSRARSTRTDLRNTILIFSLITSETRVLLCLHREARPARPRARGGRSTSSTTPSSTACPSSSRRSSTPSSSTSRWPGRRTACETRVENSHGILKDCFQQSVVQLAQVFDPAVRGQRHLPGLHGQARAVGACCATAWPG